ncbi:facilitated trehalose transporter Tret1-like [Chironomus tepperi]|uniref:facilitated trehalose transporter Tret1-like n=1 Tax=Chironomus tepperi TaxID=113505 RepID=UPI00391F8A5D
MGISLQYFAAFSSALGALSTGTALGWTSNLQHKIVFFSDYGFKVSELDFSILGSVLNLGAASICVLAGLMINHYGRRGTMILVLIPFILGWCLLITAINVSMLIIGRALLGMACGVCCVSCPVYVGEIADKEIRGKLGSFFQLLITTGIMFVYILGAYSSSQITSSVCGFIPVLFGVCIFFCPESPTFYVMRGKHDKAIKSLARFRDESADLYAELNYLIEEDELRRSQNVKAALRRKSSIKGMVIALGLMFFQQLSGINAVIFYTTTIFKDAKIEIKPEFATIVLGIIQVAATFIATLTVDKIGRKMLLIISGIFMALCTLVLGVYYGLKETDVDSVKGYGWITLLSLCVFIIAFSLGFGPVAWIMIGEIFTSDVKGFAGSMAGTLNWSLAFAVTAVYPTIRDLIGPSACFLIFTILSTLGILFSIFIVPETKGKSLAEIQQTLDGK